MDPNVQAALIGGGITAFVWVVNKAVETGKRLQKQVETTTHLNQQDAKLEGIERLSREARDAVREQNGNVKTLMERTTQLDKRITENAMLAATIVESKSRGSRK